MWHLDKRANKRDATFNNAISDDIIIDGQTEYFDLLKSNGDINYPKIINVRADFSSEDNDEFMLVYSVSSKDGKVLEWQGHHLSDFSVEEGENEIFMSFKLPSEGESDNQISIYFWNPNRKTVRLKNLVLTSFKDSHYPQLY